MAKLQAYELQDAGIDTRPSVSLPPTPTAVFSRLPDDDLELDLINRVPLSNNRGNPPRGKTDRAVRRIAAKPAMRSLSIVLTQLMEKMGMR